MATKWTKDQVDFLKDNYGAISNEELCHKLNKTWSSITHKVSRENIKSPRMWSEEELQYLKDNYKTKTYKEIAQNLGRTIPAVELKVRRLMLKKSKYEYNHSFFKNIQTEAQSYWCGFIMADGCVAIDKRTNSCELCIKLQAGDYKHLKKFNKSLDGNVPVTFFNKMVTFPKKSEPSLSHQCQIRLYSEEMVHDIAKYGVIPNKSLVKKFPNNIPENLMNHFIRGYFDGNGTIGFVERKHKYCSFATGSKDFAEGLHSYLNEKVCKTSGIYLKKDSNVYSFSLKSFESMYLFLTYLYKDATIYLDRKFHKKEQFFNSPTLERYLLRQSEMVG